MALTKKTKILYWIINILFALLMFGSGIPDILSNPIAVKGMHEELGYPLYFLPFIGVAKALGAIAILIPGFSRIKEWAYAGLIFDLIAAMYSIMAAGKEASDWAPMVFPITLAVSAYLLYHKKIKEENG
jgi:uncharacterized membrane protein YphA (DoxX/SURF4 family)